MRRISSRLKLRERYWLCILRIASRAVMSVMQRLSYITQSSNLLGIENNVFVNRLS